MIHNEDPREALLKQVGDLSGVEVMGSDVLCAIYIRPEKTASGLYIPDSTRDEDKFQGKALLVLKMGPYAYKDDEGKEFRDIKEGDWVVGRASDGWACTLNSVNNSKIDCRVFRDIDLRLRISSPDVIY
jgi:co-chaperonin GroES (HSP10)